jgi:hypothetical protein
MPAYLVGTTGIDALCPGAVPKPALAPDPTLGVRVLAVPKEGCGAPGGP